MGRSSVTQMVQDQILKKRNQILLQLKKGIFNYKKEEKRKILYNNIIKTINMYIKHETYDQNM